LSAIHNFKVCADALQGVYVIRLCQSFKERWCKDKQYD